MAREAAILSVLLEANDQLSGKLTKAQRQLDVVERQAKRGIRAQLGASFNDEAFRKYQAATESAMRKAADRKAFRAELGANFSPAGFRAYQKEVAAASASTSKAEKETGRLRDTVGKLGGALVAAGAGFAAFETAKGAIESTLQLAFATSKLTAATGLDAKTASSWIEVMKQRGVQANALAMGFITLERNIRNASDGSKAAKLAFEQLGIPIKGLKDANLQDTIELIAQKFEKLGSPVERAALAQQLFGRNAKVLLPVLSQGSAGIEELLGAAQRYGAYIDDKQLRTFMRAHEAQLQMNLAMDGLKIAFTQVALPAIVKVADGVLKFVRQMREGEGAGGRFASRVSSAFHTVSSAFSTVIGFLGGMRNVITVIEGMTAAWIAFRATMTLVAIASNPLLLALVAIGVAAAEIIKHWKPISAFFVETWRTIEHAVGQGASAVLGAVSGMIRAFASVAGVKVLGHRVFGGVSDDLNHAADSIDHLRQHLRMLGVELPGPAHIAGTAVDNIVTKFEQMHQKVKNSTGKTHTEAVKNFNQMKDQLSLAMKVTEASVERDASSMFIAIGQGSQKAADAARTNFTNFVRTVGRAVSAGAVAAQQGAKAIFDALNATLQAFGAPKIPAAVLKVGGLQSVTQYSNWAMQGASHTASPGIGHRATGGLVQIGRPGQAGRDSVPLNVGGMPIMVAPGEQVAVFNRHQLPLANALMAPVGGLAGLFNKIRTPNYMAGGGMVNFDGHPANVSSSMRSLISTMESRFPGLVVTATTDGGHASGSYHYKGQAVDMASDATTMLAAANYVRTSGIYRSLIEGIHNPNLSVHGGQFVSPSFWGASTWAQHANHIHLAIAGALGAIAGGIANAIKTPAVSGSGTIAKMVRAAVGKMTGAANAYLGSHTGGGDSGSFGLPGGVGTSNSANRALGRQMMLGYFPASQWPYLDALWNKESGWSSSARNPSSGAAGIPQDITGNFHGGAAGQIAWGLNYIRCVPLDTEILTRDGWKCHDEVRAGDETIGYNLDTGRSEWTRVTAVHHYEDAPVTEMSNRRWSSRSTPNHRWLTEKTIQPNDDPDSAYRREEFATTEAIGTRHRIRLAATADTGDGLAITIEEAEILGWVLGDGSIHRGLNNRGGKRGKLNVTISQIKSRWLDDLRDLMQHAPHSEYAYQRTYASGETVTCFTWRLTSAYARDLLKRSGYEEDLEVMVLGMSSEQRRAFLRGVERADGHETKDGHRMVAQNEGPSLDAILLAVYLEGHYANPVPSSGQQHVYLSRPFIKGGMGVRALERQPVWCVTTDLGTWTMRQDGRAMLTGNSRYGSPSAAWAHEQKFNWYGRGGMLPFAGSFDQGGTVPGPRGMPSMAVVHGGERITGLAGGGIIGRALAAHPAWRVPLNLPALATIPSQSTTGQIQVQGIQNQLQSAQNTGNTGGQQNALTRLLRVERSWLSRDKAKLKKINQALGRRDLSKKQRAALLQDKLNLLQEINTVESDIGSTQTQLSDLSTSTDTTGGGDTGGGGDTSAQDALNAQTQAIEAQTQMLADIKASIDAQNAAINGITQVELKQALKAFSDVVSGQIGGLAYSRSVASAGDGRVARY